MSRNKATRNAERSLEACKREWMVGHGLDRCALSARPEADLAHLRDKTGMAIKPEPWLTLPLDRALHDVQETGGRQFWVDAGLPLYEDHAAELHAAFLTGNAEFADALLRATHDNANLDFLATILRKAA